MAACREVRVAPKDGLLDLRREIAAMWDLAPLTPIRINRKRIRFRHGWLVKKFTRTKQKRALSIRRHKDGTVIRVDSGCGSWQVKARSLRRGVYILGCGGRLKIGKAKNVATRLRDIRHMNGSDLHLVGWFPGEYTELESRLHRALKRYRLYGEWFRAETSLLRFLETQPGFCRDVSADELRSVLHEPRANDNSQEGSAT
jgi:hypothetical protein